MKIRTLFTSLLLLGVSILLPNVSKAAFLTFDNTNPDDTVTVSFGGFAYPDYFQLWNGSSYYYYAPSGVATVPELAQVNFYGAWYSPTGPNSGSNTIYLAESLGAGGVISDKLTYSWYTEGYNAGGAKNIISGTFKSDNASIDLGFLTGSEQNVFLKGSPVSFNLPNFDGLILTDGPANVPDGGATLTMIGSVLIGLATLRRRFAA
jgi:hypothetical protein